MPPAILSEDDSPRWRRELHPAWKSLRDLAHADQKYSKLDESSPQHPYRACILLRQAGIPCKIWGHDLQDFPGLPSDKSELPVLVSDPERATEVLKNNGYIPLETRPGGSIKAKLRTPIPAQVPVLTKALCCSSQWKAKYLDKLVSFNVLIFSAAEYKYSLQDEGTGLRHLIPRLHEYFICTVEKWLDLEQDQHTLRLGIPILLSTQFHRTEEAGTWYFKHQIPKEYRQLLFDILANVVLLRDMVRWDCLLHYREVRDGTLEGRYKPFRPPQMPEDPLLDETLPPVISQYLESMDEGHHPA
ncbi:hypothetical protein P170DRAFT_480618 [Aspergillus steynii IBT 23096]|uniref:Uncharacterized protein n=1 Tax=Aspergillus steynii IBT 23096 TaxID=1392250 RepID=A0A2I2FSR1_9EURO|nr:uncharacterized protein P170DRAFT_480618 [Aspergillus steynii IBT 23096]PLB43659.1 hypothetical protein P170DRAFT_480618 [Aspergillus steynii IBT 23096]